MQKLETRLAIVALASVVLAWLAGLFRYEADLAPFLHRAVPEADRFDALAGQIYAGRASQDSDAATVGYAAVSEAQGYGGPLRVAVGVDLGGTVQSVVVVDHKETSPYFRRVERNGFPDVLTGKNYSDPFRPGSDVDAVAGATRTVDALTESVRTAARGVARDALMLPVPAEESPSIQFGFPELTLLLLFGAGLAERVKGLKGRKLLRWASLLTGLVVLGFVYDIPLTLVNINSLMVGYWPNWQTHLYWYILVVGVLLTVLWKGSSPYCRSFCPFGAVQECLGTIGGTPVRLPLSYRCWLRWMPRILAWGAILLALVYRNPALSSYEVFGTLFDVTGSHFQFGLLAIVLVASLFLTRPWCNYLCPLRAVTDFLRLLRRQFLVRARFLLRRLS